VLILEGADNLPRWDATTVDAFVVDLHLALPQLAIEWDSGAGEEWIRVLESGDPIAQVRAPTTASLATRFAFVDSTRAAAAALVALLRHHTVEVSEVADLDDPMLSIRPEDLAAFSMEQSRPNMSSTRVGSQPTISSSSPSDQRLSKTTPATTRAVPATRIGVIDSDRKIADAIRVTTG
jgi:hypothetical protein